ncbi:MAG: hypothetical protein JRH20_27415 [Deltaproteobacteria bacterium]|nr:hypothetical protein [Deltaproteobacteria bacterium]
MPHNAGDDWTYKYDSPHSHSIYEDNWSCIAARLNVDGSPPVPPIPVNYTPDAFYRLGGDSAAYFPEHVINIQD